MPNTPLIIHPDDENVLDLYNVDYVCKVDFVDGDFILQKLEEYLDVEESGDK